MAARIKVDMGASKTATVAEAQEAVAVAATVEVALIEVAVEVAAEVAVEAWGRCPLACCGRGSGFLLFMTCLLLVVKSLTSSGEGTVCKSLLFGKAGGYHCVYY